MTASHSTASSSQRLVDDLRTAERAATADHAIVHVSVAAPAWSYYWLWAAGIYNLLWGFVTIAAPNLLFDLTGIPRVNYPEIWQCVGMIVGVYGIGYAIAAYDSRRHWPIVLVGLLGKIFGPIGFVGALLKGTFPLAFGATILTNDLVWWIPFTLILWDAWRAARSTSGR
ncbi:MAG: alkyl hydroperoxide reductase [Planctomycetota bacterium]